ncbi:MAG: hypothetical protein ACYTEP_06720 [Planctomycetota bacterium]|jgi:poly(3-hydroxybutyrate) depolymerase
MIGLALLILGWASLPQEETVAKPPRVLLHEAVSMPKAKDRLAAAKELAKRRDVDLGQWIALMRDFGDFDIPSPGASGSDVKLLVGTKMVSTRLDVYVPSTYRTDTPSPLLLLLHGAGGNGRGLLHGWTRFAEEQGYLLLAPTDPGANEGYAFTQDERDAGLSALRWMRLHYNVDENRIHMHGVSRGGHMAWDLAVRHPDLFTSLVPAIGGPTWVISGGRNNMRLVENLWDIPIRDLQGSQDDPRLLRNLHLSFARIHAAGNGDALLMEFPELGHSFRTDQVDWAEFFGGAMRNPTPPRILYRTARKENQRVSWLLVDRIAKSVDETFPIKVDPKQWQRWNDEQKASHIQGLADDRTAQAIGSRNDSGTFHLDLQGVSKVALMLPSAWIPEDKKVEVTVGQKTRSLKAKPSKRVLLQDFVERFDRTFLPVATIPIKP